MSRTLLEVFTSGATGVRAPAFSTAGTRTHRGAPCDSTPVEPGIQAMPPGDLASA
jgi:hypothetical protein